MVDWKDWREQCRSDLFSCKLLYKAGQYGNAAYLIQQAVEKYAKGILTLGNVMPAHKTHVPLAEFVVDIIPALQKIDAIATKFKVAIGMPTTTANIQHQYLVQCEGVMKELKKKNEYAKMALWKSSLGLHQELDAQEQAFFQKYPLFIDYGKISLKKVVAFAKNSLDGDAFQNEANADPDVKKLHYYKPVAELGRLIAATFPHEDFGRFPTDITTRTGKQVSTTLYKQQKAELLKLIETAEGYLKV